MSSVTAEQVAITPEQAADPMLHMQWAKIIARDVAKAYRIRDASGIEELESAALLEMCKRRARFQPEDDAYDLIGAYRGWSFRAVKTACQKEAERVLNGGTYNERRRITGEKQITVDHFSAIANGHHTSMESDPFDFVVTSSRQEDSRNWWEKPE